MTPLEPTSLYGPTPRRQERRRTERPLIPGEPPICPLQSVLDSHAQALDAAHGKLRDADGELAELSAITTHAVSRLVHLEKSSREQEQLLAALQGGIEAIRTEQTGLLRAIQSLADVSVSTHEMLIQHIDTTKVTEAAEHKERLLGHEQKVKYLIKIAGLLAAAVVSLVLIHGALTGKSVVEALFGWMP